tara:strand:+ start:141 stop:467 length:327 start_codon:yes stop_codon:yes gene_type:complete
MSITNGALYDRFDLEESIMQMANILDDIKILSENVMEDSECDKDKIINALVGMETIYQMRFDKTIDIMEYCVRTRMLDNNNHISPNPNLDYKGKQLDDEGNSESRFNF